MVVIKGTLDELSESFGNGFPERIRKFSDVIGYTVEVEEGEIKVEFNPDRPDLFSFLSLNCAMKCFYDRDFWIRHDMQESGVELEVTRKATGLRNYAASFVAKGPGIAENLEHLIEYQERLHDGVGKNRSKVSIGLHDLDKVKPPFLYDALPRSEIKFTTYDGEASGSAEDILATHPKGQMYSKLIKSDSLSPVILDSEKDVLSLPPVVNGLKSKVEKSTRRFFIDITGTDRKATRDAYFLLMYELEHMGYSIQSVNMKAPPGAGIDSSGYDGRKISLERSEVIRTAGLAVSKEEAIQMLRMMGFMAEPSSKWIDVHVPGNRVDVMGQVDVIEDLAKAYGIQKIEEREIDLPIIGEPDRKNDFSELLKDALVGAGLQEVRTFVVSSSGFYRNLHYEGGLEVMNPKSLEYSMVRDRLFINILELLRINKRRPLPHRVFEIGEIYSAGEQKTRLCCIIMDSKASFSSIKQVLDYISIRLGTDRVQIIPSKEEGFIEGRAGRAVIGGRDAGFIGELHPDTIVGFDLAAPACALELDVGALMEIAGNIK